MWKQLTAPRPYAFDEFMFELAVFEQLRHAGVAVLEIEPGAPKEKAPDFLCALSDRTFYVEVVTVHDDPFHRQELDRLSSDLRHLLKTGFVAALDVERYSDKVKLDVCAVRHELKRQIHENRGRETFECVYQPVGWSLRFRLKRPGNERSSFISSLFYGVRRVDVRKRIVESLSDKMKKYGRLAHPLVIFVNILSDSVGGRLEDGLDAMYGTVGLSFDAVALQNLEELRGEFVRAPNGVCSTSSQKAQLDSVAFFEGFQGCSLHVPAHVRVVNPLCAAPLLNVFSEMPTILVDAQGALESLGEMPAQQRWFHEIPTRASLAAKPSPALPVPK